MSKIFPRYLKWTTPDKIYIWENDLYIVKTYKRKYAKKRHYDLKKLIGKEFIGPGEIYCQDEAMFEFP